MPTESTPPTEIAESIAIVNATAFGEHPAILANLALAQQIFNTNLQQQLAISQQQALNQVRLAVVAKCVSLILSDPSGNLQATKAAVDLLQEVPPPAPAPSIEAKPVAAPAAPAAHAAAPSASAAPSSATPQASPDGLAETLTAVAISNLKAIGEQPALLANLAFSNAVANTNLSQQNAVSNQQAMNELGIAVVANAVNVLADFATRAATDIPADRSLADQIADLRAVIQAFSAKSA